MWWCVIRLQLVALSAFLAYSSYVFNANKLEKVGSKAWGHFKVQETSNNASSLGPVVAFYHIYAGGDSFHGIVKEQINHLHAVGLYPLLDQIFYTTIGPAVDSLHVPEGKFHHLHHFEEVGEEIYTLGLLYRFCHAHPSSRVLYFHDKGSYHNTTLNTHFRRLMECHTVNPQCLFALEKYDTCGLRASPIPHPHYSGNFWWARCQYVQTLVDPWWQVTNETFAGFNNHSLHRCAGAQGRFLAESWLLSAPTVLPADCISAEVDTSYIFGYHFPVVFDKFCPNIDGNVNLKSTAPSSSRSLDHSAASSRTPSSYGTGQCALASTWRNASSFAASVKKHKSGCAMRSHVTDIVRRCYQWYGQKPTSYLQWIDAYENNGGERKGDVEHKEEEKVTEKHNPHSASDISSAVPADDKKAVQVNSNSKQSELKTDKPAVSKNKNKGKKGKHKGKHLA